MPTRVYIAKAVNPEQLGWRARIARNEKPVMASFLAWVAELRLAIGEANVAHAIITRSVSAFDHVVQAVAFQPDLSPVAEAEAVREFEQVVRQVDASLHLSFDLRDPNFTRVVTDHQAAMVREVTDETRRAIANLIDRAYRQGLHPYEVAPQIRQMVGLTRRQAQAVMNYRDSLVKAGRKPDQVARMTDRYSTKMLNRRAKTIGRTETARAAVLGRLQSYEQAAANGLFDRATAELEWSSVQTDPAEICAQLDGDRVPFGQTFDGLLPPAHPACRCSVHLVIGDSSPPLSLAKFDPDELRDFHGRWTIGGAIHALSRIGVKIDGNADVHTARAIAEVMSRDFEKAGPFPAAMQGTISLVPDRRTYMASMSMGDHGIGIHAPDLTMPALEQSFSKAPEGYNAVPHPDFAYSLFHELGHIRQLQYAAAFNDLSHLLETRTVKFSDFGKYVADQKDEDYRYMEAWAEAYAAARTGQASYLPQAVQDVLAKHGIEAI